MTETEVASHCVSDRAVRPPIMPPIRSQIDALTLVAVGDPAAGDTRTVPSPVVTTTSGVLLAEYCIDERRIFATGHSSGAQMLCKGEQRFRAVAPVAASKYCAEVEPVPVLYIQGQMDAQRSGGNWEDVVRVFRSSNACAETSMPVTSISSCPSSFDRKDVAPGCVSYDSCTAATLWCSHNDNGYNDTDGRQHGWPCFASEAIADFFLGF
jgi:polyhydroxybutyrate depolymerase